MAKHNTNKANQSTKITIETSPEAIRDTLDFILYLCVDDLMAQRYNSQHNLEKEETKK